MEDGSADFWIGLLVPIRIFTGNPAQSYVGPCSRNPRGENCDYCLRESKQQAPGQNQATDRRGNLIVLQSNNVLPQFGGYFK